MTAANDIGLELIHDSARFAGLVAEGHLEEAAALLPAVQLGLGVASTGATAGLTRATDLVESTRALLARIRSGEETCVTTGFAQLDEQLDGGLWPGLHMLVGGTGSGKTQLAIQIALHAAQQGVPSVYVPFEMSAQVAMLRVLGEIADVPWGKLMRGHPGADEQDRIERACQSVPSLLQFEHALPYRWPVSRIAELGTILRRQHPTGPALIVVDYAQLAGDPSIETRQRVMAIALELQVQANRHRIAALALSSTARPGYGALADIVSAGGLGDEQANGGRRRTIQKPYALIGLGKESGEIEYSAESVTVLGSAGSSAETGRILVAATVKSRTGSPSWCALRFADGRLRAAPGVQGVDDLPTAPESRAELERRVLQAVEQGEYTSTDQLREYLHIGKRPLTEVLQHLKESGRVEKAGQRSPWRRVAGKSEVANR